MGGLNRPGVSGDSDPWEGYSRASINLSERLAEDGIAASVGEVGSSYVNPLAEGIDDLHKTGLMKPRGPSR